MSNSLPPLEEKIIEILEKNLNGLNVTDIQNRLKEEGNTRSISSISSHMKNLKASDMIIPAEKITDKGKGAV